MLSCSLFVAMLKILLDENKIIMLNKFKTLLEILSKKCRVLACVLVF